MLETNTAGHVSADQRYRAYGRQRDSGPVVTDHRFTGQKYDGTGLYYYNARYYDPALGAFISPDTIVPRPGGSRTNLLAFNRYMYTLGNPLRYTDPSGHFWETVADVAAIGYDVYDIYENGWSWGRAGALTADVVGAAVPFMPAPGACVRWCDDVMRHSGDGTRWVGERATEGWQATQRFFGKGDAATNGAKVATDCLTNSFSGDTLVMTASGAKPIAELVEGDLVLAFNEANGQLEVHPVTDTISHIDPEIVLLTIDGEVLETTAGHPFYEMDTVPGLVVGQYHRRWTDAGALEAGDLVWQADGTTGVVEAVEVVDRPQRMYNLTVAEAHTFFVGDGAWLVHNCGGLIAGTRGLDHSFDRHAHEWWGMMKPSGEDAARFSANYKSQWQELVERASNSGNVVDWSTGGDATRLHLAFIDGKHFAVQFFTEGDRAGELATAFIPNSDQLRAINELLRR